MRMYLCPKFLTQSRVVALSSCLCPPTEFAAAPGTPMKTTKGEDLEHPVTDLEAVRSILVQGLPLLDQELTESSIVQVGRDSPLAWDKNTSPFTMLIICFDASVGSRFCGNVSGVVRSRETRQRGDSLAVRELRAS